MVTLLMAGEPWTYAVMQGQFSLDSHWRGKCFIAGSKEWMRRAVNFYRDMTARFLEVCLCELDWKSEQIASEIYSQWRCNWINKQEAEKTKGKSLPKQLVEEGPSHKKMKISKSRSESVTLDSSPTDLSDLVMLHII